MRTKSASKSDVIEGLAELGISKDLQKRIGDQVKGEVRRLAAAGPLRTARITNYLLIDFGFTGDYFYPNSVQFYDATGFLCAKLIDNNSLVSLVPILNCQNVYVTWDTTTSMAVHVYGSQPKP